MGDFDANFDGTFRIVSETSSGQTHLYLQDLADNRGKVTHGGTSREVTSSYDALNWLTSIGPAGGRPDAPTSCMFEA